MAAGRSFDVLACRLHFLADEPVRFPETAANTFRGALGYVLDQSIFRPRQSGGASGLADPPRPFVLQAEALNARTVEGGFDLGLNLFDPSLELEFKAAFEQVAAAGITARRRKLRLDGWTARRVTIPLTDAPEASRVRVRFETPVELKGWDGDGLPPFGVLARRLRDRLSALRALYGPGALEIDFQGFGERADRVSVRGGRMEAVKGERRSARTGMIHPLGGLVGWAEYEGDLGEFVPYLRAGAYTGVGRQTVWGRGRLGLELPA
jgi:hypothetical protein